MNKTISALVPVAVMLVIGISPAIAQEARPATPEEIVSELAGIRTSLDDLVTLVSAMRRNQDAELILRRIEMHERRLAPLEKRLDSNKSEQLDTEKAIVSVQDWIRQSEERIFEIEREGREEVPLQLRQEAAMGETELERLKTQLETLRRQQIELENSLLDRREDVEVLDDLLQELLD